MEEKNFKKLLTEQTEEIKRHSKILLEEFQSQLKVLAEVQINHGHKLNVLLEMVANNTGNIELIIKHAKT
jgi:hypothetical protein